MTTILVDTPAKSPKEDLIRKLKLVHGIVVILDFHGDSLGVILFFDGEQSLSRTIELISRITNAEKITQIPVIFPHGQANCLADIDWEIIHNMEKDALKSHVQIAKELGYTARTVKNRLQRLERLRALMIPPTLDIAAIDRMIALILYYSYTNHGMKNTVDQAMLSHLIGNYLWARLNDPERAYLILVAPTMASVKTYLEWTKQQAGVASARAEIVIQSIDLWNKASELFQETFLLQKNS